MKKKNITISDVEASSKRKPITMDIKEDTSLIESQLKKNSKKEKKIETPEQKEKRKKAKRILFLVLFAIVGFSIAGALVYSIFAFNPNKTSDLIKMNSGVLKVGTVKNETLKSFPIPEPQVPPTKINLINGLFITDATFKELMKTAPVAVMVNNHVAARPQTNLTQADLVYETLAEGGISRYMAVYWQNPVSEVGPIRSVRQYYLEWLSEYNAIFIHDGYASSTDLRVDAGGNIWRYGIRDIATQGAWRDHTRYAPHNEYSSVANAMNIGIKKSWVGFPSGFETWKFKNDALKKDRGTMKEVSIKFHERLNNGGLYDAKWVYDIDTNSYARFIGGQPDLDKANNQQIHAKVVIIQMVNLIPTGDDKGHIIIETMGEGDATILFDGKVIEGKWKKKSRTERTFFFDKAGNQIEFNRGLIWICAVPQNDGSFDIIEQ